MMLKDKVALVTGGASEIGRATTLQIPDYAETGDRGKERLR